MASGNCTAVSAMGVNLRPSMPHIRCWAAGPTPAGTIMAGTASALFLCAYRTHRTTLARLTEYLFATCVSDIPERRSATSRAWSTWIGDLPRLNPSSLRRRPFLRRALLSAGSCALLCTVPLLNVAADFSFVPRILSLCE